MSSTKTKSISLSKLKSHVWTQFSLFIRLRDSWAWQSQHPEYNGDPGAPCVTCNRWYKALGVGCLQAGHFIPGRSNQVLFNELQVNAQCDSCNRHKKGNWPAYYEVMIQRHGHDIVSKMIEDRNKVLEYPRNELETMLDLYKFKVSELKEKLNLTT